MDGWFSQNAGPFLFGSAAVAWYLACSLLTACLIGRTDSPGRRAIAPFLCNIPIVFLSISQGRFEIAVGIIFATSVAALTLVLGLVIQSAPGAEATLSRRAWAMVLPVALVNLLIGFRSGFHRLDALILLAQGLAILPLWRESFANSDKPSYDPAKFPSRAALMFGGLLLAIFAGAAGSSAAHQLSLNLKLPSAGLVTAVIVTPALALPQIGVGLRATHEGRFDHAASGLVGFVLLNLCLLLPLATLAQSAMPLFDPPPQAMIAPATLPATTSAADAPPPIIETRSVLPFPMAVWRVDTVLLVAVGLLLLPVSQGKWSLGKTEGIALMITYAIFMLLTVLAVATNWL